MAGQSLLSISEVILGHSRLDWVAVVDYSEAEFDEEVGEEFGGEFGEEFVDEFGGEFGEEVLEEVHRGEHFVFDAVGVDMQGGFLLAAAGCRLVGWGGGRQAWG